VSAASKSALIAGSGAAALEPRTEFLNATCAYRFEPEHHQRTEPGGLLLLSFDSGMHSVEVAATS